MTPDRSLSGSLLGVPFRATLSAAWWTLELADGLATLRLRAPELPPEPAPTEPEPEPQHPPDLQPDHPPTGEPSPPVPEDHDHDDHDHDHPDPVVPPLPEPGPPPADPRTALEAAVEAETAAWIAAQEHAHPHGDDLVKRSEHEAAMAPVDAKLATHRAIQSGPWSDPDTWAGQRLPDDGARVWIMPGRTVVLDTDTVRLQTVRVTGTLGFWTIWDATLFVDTLVIDPAGTLLIGTEANPISPDVTARIVFLNTGPFDPAVDPFRLGRGLICHGKCEINGAAVTSHLPLARHPRPGDTQLELVEQPNNWKVGDDLIVSTFHPTEPPLRRTIRAIEGTSVTVDFPLEFGYIDLPPDEDCRSYVAHLTRNVIFESEDPDSIDARGHVMFMHSAAGLSIRNAAFINLGRTDKSRPVTDPELDADGHLVPGSADNPRGRYALHFHRCGADLSKSPIVVEGCVVDGSPGWGFVNHASHVHFRHCVAAWSGSSGFVGETGSEIGEFAHCFGAGCRMLGVDSIDPVRGDAGREGPVFYSASSAIVFRSNVACSSPTGFRIGQYGHVEAGQRVLFARSNVADPTKLPPLPGEFQTADMILPNYVPLLLVDNTAFALGVAFSQANHKGGEWSLIDGLFAWNVGAGLATQYSDAFTLRRSKLLRYAGDPVWGFACGMDWNTLVRVEDSILRGFWQGLACGFTGRTIVRNTTIDCVINIVIGRTDAGFEDQVPRRSVEFENVTFGPGPVQPADAMFKHADIYIYSDRDQRPSDSSSGLWYSLGQHLVEPVRDRRLPALFHPDLVRIRVGGKMFQVYSDDQRPEYVYRDTGLPELDGKTVREVWEVYHLSIGDAVVPEGTMRDLPEIVVDGGVLGSVTPLRATLNARFFDIDKHPTVRVEDAGIESWRGNAVLVFDQEVNTQPGRWNVVTGITDVAGNPRGVLVKDTRAAEEGA